MRPSWNAYGVWSDADKGCEYVLKEVNAGLASAAWHIM